MAKDTLTISYVPELQRLVTHYESLHNRLLDACNTAPMAVGIPTRDLETAVRKLIDFAWEAVQGEPSTPGDKS